MIRHLNLTIISKKNHWMHVSDIYIFSIPLHKEFVYPRVNYFKNKLDIKFLWEAKFCSGGNNDRNLEWEINLYIERRRVGSSNCQLSMFHRVLEIARERNSIVSQKGAFLNSRSSLYTYTYTHTQVSHYVRATRTSTHARTLGSIYRFICSVILGYIFWHSQRSSVYFACIRKSSPTGQINDVSNDKQQTMLILLGGSVHRA